MAHLKRFTSIANDEEEVHSFTNPAYHVTSDDPEDLEQKWQTQDEEEIFKPPPKRCTMFNVAVALFILAAGGLAVVLIIKMSEDNYSVQTTPRPIPLKTSPHTTVSTSQSTTNPKDTTTTSGMRTTTMTSTLSDRQTTRSSTSRPTSTTITSRTTTTETLPKSTTVTTGSPLTTSSSTTTTSEATTSTTVATTTTERSTSTAPSTTTVLSTAMPSTTTTSTIPPSITTTTTPTIPPSTTTKTTSTLPPSTTTTPTIPPSTTTTTTIPPSTTTSTIPPSTTTTSTLPTTTTTTSTLPTTTKTTSTIPPSTTTTSTLPPLTTTTSTIPPSTTTTSTLPSSTTTGASFPGQSPATTTTTTTTTTITTTNQTTLQPQTSTRTATMLTTATTSKAAIENTTLIPQTTSTSTEASKPPTTLSTTTQTSTYQPTMTNSTTTTSTTIQSSMKTSPPELSSTASSTSISNTSISTTIVPSSSTLGAVNHTTGDPINSTETGGLTFEASLKVTSITWSDDYQNTTSEAYQELVSNFTHQVEDAIQSSEVGESFSHVSVESVRPGSVVFDFRVVMKTSAFRVNESQALVTPSVVRRVLVTAVQNAKNSGRQLLLSGVDVNNISVVVATPTTQPTRSTMSSTAVSNMKTTASTQQPTVAMTTIPNNTTVFPCTDMDYLRNTLLSHCLDVTQMNVVASSNSQDEKCQFVLAAVDCILQKITADFDVTCSEEHKRSALVGFSDIIQSYLAIDPVTCLMTTLTSTPTVKNSTNTPSSTTLSTSLSATTTAIAQTTASSTKPRTTVAMTTTPHNKTVFPCTDMDYLRNTLLSHCLNVTQMNVVASSNSQDEKCQFVLAAVDCILQKITADFDVTCSEEHKRSALVGFSDIIQSYLAIDPVTCLMTTLTSTPTVKNSTNTPSSTISHSTTSVTRSLSTSLSATTTAIAQTTASSTEPRTTGSMTTTPHNKTVSPCTDMDYLRDTLLSHCLDVTQMNVIASSNSQDEKCQFVLAGVDCILQKITADFEVTCSEEHKRSALVGFSDIIQSYLAIDPVTCLESG
ncbi:uncharacterized protein LOC111136981 isoform X2 [Crassostrea virginica]